MTLNAESKIAFVWGNGESRRKADKMYSSFWGDLRMIGTHIMVAMQCIETWC